MRDPEPSLRERLERELDDAGLSVAVSDDGARLTLTGLVDTGAEREAIFDLVDRVVGDARDVEDNVEVAGALPAESPAGDLSEVEIAGLDGAEPGLEDTESLLAGDFTEQPTVQSAAEIQAASLSDAPSDEPDAASSGDIVYVPPIDPVGGTDRVIGGLQLSSMDSLEVDRSSDGTLGDEAIRDAILRELQEDAATAGLSVEVEVVAGVARLTGRVADLDDAESAEEVAARVPGVVEVIEDLELGASG